MQRADMLGTAEALERQAVAVVERNTRMGDRQDFGYEPDLSPGAAAHASHLFAVAAGLRARVERDEAVTHFVLQRVQEETFSFNPGDGGPEIHIRSGRLREWLLANAMHKVINLTFPEEDLDTIVERHGLEEPRMRSMNVLEAGEPVIVGLCPDGSSILIDGGHRRWFWARQGRHTIRGWALPHEAWSAFTFDPNGPMVISHRADGSMLPQRRGR